MARDNGADPNDEILETLGEVGEVLNFDPFAETNPSSGSGEEPAAEPEAPPAEPPTASAPAEAPTAPTPSEEESATVPAAPQAAEAVSAPATPEIPPASPPGPSTNELLRIIAEQNREIGEMRASRRAPGASGAPTEDQGPPVPDYAFNIPDELMALVQSEEPSERKIGFQHMMAGMAQGIHRQMFGAVQEQIVPMIQQNIKNHTQEAERRKTITEDFYGSYPYLNSPAVKPMVGSIAAQVANEWQTQEWSPQMKEEVFNRVVKTLQTIQGAVGTITPGAPSNVPAPGATAPTPAVPGNQGAGPPVDPPPAILDLGVRPPQSQKGSVADEVEELLF